MTPVSTAPVLLHHKNPKLNDAPTYHDAEPWSLGYKFSAPARLRVSYVLHKKDYLDTAPETAQNAVKICSWL